MAFKLSGEPTSSPFKFSALEQQPSAMEETATRLSSALESIGPTKTDKPGSWRYPSDGPRQWQEDAPEEPVEPIAQDEMVQSQLDGKTEPGRGKNFDLPEVVVSGTREPPETAPPEPKGHYEMRGGKGGAVKVFIPDETEAGWGEVISEVPHQVIARVDKTVGGAKHMVAADRAHGARKRVWQSIVLPKAKRELEEYNASRIDERERKNLDEWPSVIEGAKLAGVRPDQFARDWPEFLDKDPETLANDRKADITLFSEQKGKRDAARKQIKLANQMATDYRPEMDEWSTKSIAFDSLSSLPDLLAGVGATAATGQPAVGLGVLFASTTPAAYADAIEAGAPEGKAQIYALLNGMAEIAPETKVMDVLARTGAGKKIMKDIFGKYAEKAGVRIASDAAFEGASESLTESLQIAIDAGVLDKDTTVKEALERIARAGVTGVAMGGGVGVVTESAGAVKEHAARKKTPQQPKPADAPSLSSKPEEAAEEPEDHVQEAKVRKTAAEYATPEEMTAADALEGDARLAKYQEYLDRGMDLSRTAEKPVVEPETKARVDQDATYENTEDQDVQQAAKVAKAHAKPEEIEAALAKPTAKERLAALQPLVDRGIDFGPKSESESESDLEAAKERRQEARAPEAASATPAKSSATDAAVEALRAIRNGTPTPEQVALVESKGWSIRNETNHSRLLPAGRRELAKAEGQVVETKVHGQEITVNVKPSEAQQASGNYQKGHVKAFGLDLAIENPAGSERPWKNQETGESGTRTMKYPYGYVKRTEGADGDAVDVFVGPNEKSKKVYVINQMKGDGSGKFDEHKAMLGFNNAEHAKAGYLRHYQKGWKGMGEVVEMTTEEFKEWAKSGNTTQPIQSAKEQALQFSRNQELARDVEKDERVKSAVFDAGTYEVELKKGFKTARGETRVKASNLADLRAKLRSVATDQPPVMFSRTAKKPTFFSPLHRFVEKARQVSATPEQWRSMIKNAQGLKREELEWSGVDEWLASHKGPIAKSEVAEFVKASMPMVEENVLGEPATNINDDSPYALPEVLKAIRAAQPQTMDDVELIIANDGDAYRALTAKFPELSEKEDWADIVTASVFRGLVDPTVHGQDALQTPGGENYRELLIRFRNEKPFDRAHKEAIAMGDQQAATLIARAAHIAGLRGRNTSRNNGTSNILNSARQPHGNEVPPGDHGHFMPFEALERAKKYLDVDREVAPFTSSHYTNFPGTMAHVRFNERQVGGEKVLFIEEIQSDWHQAGRKKGYNTTREMSRAQLELLRDEALEALSRNENWGFDTKSEALTALRTHPDWQQRWQTAPSDMPILLRYKDAFDKFDQAQKGVPDAPFKTTWPDLAMKRMIRWAAEHGFDRIAWTNGEMQSNRYDLRKRVDTVTVERVHDNGFRLSYRPRGGDARIPVNDQKPLTEDELRTYIGDSLTEKALKAGVGETHNFNENDLKIGGEGMVGFYDVQLPRIANKIGRKFGAEVTTKLIGNGMPVHSLAITPEMRDSVLEGQPLFSRTGSNGKGMHKEDVRAAVGRVIAPYRSAPISIVQKISELPFHLQQQVRRSVEDPAQLSTLDAFYDGERVWIISDHIVDQAHLVDTIYHELVVHHGLRQVMSPEDLVELQDGIWRDMEKAVRDVAQRAQLDVNDIDQRRQASEELMAYMAGKVIQGKALDPIERTTWEKIVAAVRRFFDSLGIGSYYDETKLAQLILDSELKLRDSGARAERVYAQGHVMASQKAPLWYSPMMREFEDPKLQSTATADEWLKIIQNKIATGKIRESEMKWYDLREWLASVTVGEIMSDNPGVLQPKDVPKELGPWMTIRSKIESWLTRAGGSTLPDAEAEAKFRADLAREAEQIEAEWEAFNGIDAKQLRLDMQTKDVYDYYEALAVMESVAERHGNLIRVINGIETAEGKPLAYLKPLKIPKSLILDKLRSDQLIFEMEYPKGSSSSRDEDYATLDEVTWEDNEVLFDEDYARESAEQNFDSYDEAEVDKDAAEDVRDDWDILAKTYDFEKDDFDDESNWTAYQEAKAADETVIPDFDEISDETIKKIAEEEKIWEKHKDKWIENRIESDRENEEMRRYWGSVDDPTGTTWTYEATGSRETGWRISIDGTERKVHERSNWDEDDVRSWISEWISERMDQPTPEPVAGDFEPKFENYTPDIFKEEYGEHLINWKNRENRHDVANYTHSHWSDDEDFIAHVRHYVVNTPDSKKVLVLDELQSDWHQSIRDRAVNSEDLARKFKLAFDRLKILREDYQSDKFKSFYSELFPYNRALTSVLAQQFVSETGAARTVNGEVKYTTEYLPQDEAKLHAVVVKGLVAYLKTKMSIADIQGLFRSSEALPAHTNIHQNNAIHNLGVTIAARLDRVVNRQEFFNFLAKSDKAYIADLDKIDQIPDIRERGVEAYNYMDKADYVPPLINFLGSIEGRMDNFLNRGRGIAFVALNENGSVLVNASELSETIDLLSTEQNSIVMPQYRDELNRRMAEDKVILDRWNELIASPPPVRDEEKGYVRTFTVAGAVKSFFNPYYGAEDTPDVREISYNQYIDEQYASLTGAVGRIAEKMIENGFARNMISRSAVVDSDMYKAELRNKPLWSPETKKFYQDVMASMKEVLGRGYAVQSNGDGPTKLSPSAYKALVGMGMSSDTNASNVSRYVDLPTVDHRSHAISDLRTEMGDQYNKLQELKGEATKKVPVSPPMQKTWPITIMQWAVRQAAERNLDGIALTNGSVHSRRWGSTKQINDINVMVNPDELFRSMRELTNNNPPSGSFELPIKGMDDTATVYVDQYAPITDAIFGYRKGDKLENPPPPQELYGDKDQLVVLVAGAGDASLEMIVTSKSRIPGWIGKQAGDKILKANLPQGDGMGRDAPVFRSQAGATLWWPDSLRSSRTVDIHHGSQEIYNTILPNQLNDWLKKWKLRLEPKQYDILTHAAENSGPIEQGFEGVAGDKEKGTRSIQLPTVMLTEEIKKDALEKGFPLLFSRKWYQRAKNVANRVVVGGSNFDVADPSDRSRAWNYLVYKTQDKFVDLFKTQQEAAAWHQVAAIPDQMDAYLQQTLYHGRAENGVKEHEKQFVDPLIKMIKDSGYEWEDVEDYLYARHAPEANAHLASINPGKPNVNSGMTDIEAAQVMGDLAARGDIRKLAAIGGQVDLMTKWSRDQMVMNGLEDAATIQAWENTYKFYVPLKGWKDQVNDPDVQDFYGMPKKGKGFDTGGKLTKRRTGRTSRAATILANVVAQAQATIVLAEKAKVGRAFYDFVKATPSSRLWSVDEVEYQPYVDPNTGLVRQGVNPQYKLADNVIRVKVGGKDFHITLNSEIPQMRRIAEAMKNLSPDQVGLILGFAHRINRFLSAVNTSLNPEFTVTNLLRDLQTALINLNEVDLDGIKRSILGDWRKAWWAIRRGEQKSTWIAKNHTAQWASEWAEFKEQGAKVGWIDHYKNAVDLDRVLQRKLGPDGAVQWTAHGIRRLGDFVENENLAVENALRLSTYVNLRNAGVSKQRAAEYAKNLTVNFNRKGQAGTYINSLYLFFNAAVQGTARLFIAAKNPKVRRVMYGIMAAAMAREILNRMLGGEDDDGELLYDKIPEGEKERNMIFMLPEEMRWKTGAGETVSYVKIPLPYGYNVIDYTGQKIGKLVDRMFIGNVREYSPYEESLLLVGSMVNAFSPLGDPSTSFSQFIAPTVLDPWVQLDQNKAWHGGKLMPDDYPGQPPSPDSQKFFRSTPAAYKEVAAYMNKISGGTEITPGRVDISPETMQLFVDTAGGGLARFVTSMIDAPTKDPEERELRDIPFLRRVVGAVGDRQGQELFYTRMVELERARDEIDAAYEIGLGTKEGDERLALIQSKYPIASKMIRDAYPNFGDSSSRDDAGRRKVMKALKDSVTPAKPVSADAPTRQRSGRRRAITSDLKDARREISRLEMRSGIPETERKEKVEAQKKIIRDTITDFNKRWSEIEDSTYGERNGKKLLERLGPLINGKDKKEATTSLREAGLSETAALFAELPSTPDRFAREYFLLEASREHS